MNPLELNVRSGTGVSFQSSDDRFPKFLPQTTVTNHMVSEGIIGALVGGGFAVAGSAITGWINRQNTQDRIKADNERRRGEYYLQKKVEALMNLYAVVEETRREYKKTADKAVYGEISQQEYDEVVNWYHKYERAMDRAAVFLSEEQHETLLEAFNKIHDTNSFLHRKIDNPEQDSYSEFGLSEYNERFDAVEEVLKDEINGPIKEFESD